MRKMGHNEKTRLKKGDEKIEFRKYKETRKRR